MLIVEHVTGRQEAKQIENGWFGHYGHIKTQKG